MSKTKLLMTILFVIVFGVLSLNAQIFKDVTLHGFGAWGYGNTDNGHYQFGDEDGDFDHSQFYLNVNANLSEKLAIISQIGCLHREEGTVFEFDYAFAEWTFSDSLKFRVGKVKHPFGIYGEVLNVGTIRPFLTLPQGIYGRQGFVGRGINGIGFTGSLFTKGKWSLDYDIYWGQLKTVAEMPNIISYPLTGDPETLNDGIMLIERDLVGLIGGRISVSTPFDGLNIGVFGYLGEDKKSEGAGEGGFTGNQKSYGLFLEFLSTKVWIRSEYVRNIQNATSGQGGNLETITDCFYVEAAYKFLKNFQVAVRYDWNDGEIEELDMNMLPRFFQEYMKHRDIAFGINYWFNSNIVLKLSYHMVQGINHFSPHFQDPIAFLMGEFDNKSNLIQFGAHFSF